MEKDAKMTSAKMAELACAGLLTAEGNRRSRAARDEAPNLGQFRDDGMGPASSPTLESWGPRDQEKRPRHSHVAPLGIPSAVCAKAA